MRIAILCFGSQGDVRPFVALGSALKTDGYEVAIFANSPNEQLCLENGLAFIPLAGDLTALAKSKQPKAGLGKVEVAKQLAQILRDSLRERFKILRAYFGNIDGVLYHPAVFAEEHLVEAFQLPSVRIHFQPGIRSKHYARSLFCRQTGSDHSILSSISFIGVKRFIAMA